MLQQLAQQGVAALTGGGGAGAGMGPKTETTQQPCQQLVSPVLSQAVLRKTAHVGSRQGALGRRSQVLLEEQSGQCQRMYCILPKTQETS